VISKFFELLKEACSGHPDRRYLICPPMYRMRPIWYRDGLPDILTIFSTSFAKTAVTVKNLHALPGFPTPSFEADGVHLSAYCGLEFVLHLFDSAKIVLDNLTSTPEVR